MNNFCEDLIKARVDVDKWDESIIEAGNLLLKNGYVKEEYITAMINMVKDLGPYIVIAPGIALAHARPEDGVVKTGLSMITLKKPISFGNKANDPVDIVFALGAADSNNHLDLLGELSAFLSDNENLEVIRNSTCEKEIFDCINNFN